ncbi:MAG: hypothetical protein CM15mP120_06180 [Pseudomonadota bacterium]|nr:MAG: hypothetical protein CM15mP120_06180 [Pseudomonadota bacterium]
MPTAFGETRARNIKSRFAEDVACAKRVGRARRRTRYGKFLKPPNKVCLSVQEWGGGDRFLMLSQRGFDWNHPVPKWIPNPFLAGFGPKTFSQGNPGFSQKPEYPKTNRVLFGGKNK